MCLKIGPHFIVPKGKEARRMKPPTGDEFILLESIGNRMEKNQSSEFSMSRNTKNQLQDDSRTNNKSK